MFLYEKIPNLFVNAEQYGCAEFSLCIECVWEQTSEMAQGVKALTSRTSQTARIPSVKHTMV